MHLSGTGQNTRNFLFVEDVARAFEVILFKGKVGMVYNIGKQLSLSWSISLIPLFLLPLCNYDPHYVTVSNITLTGTAGTTLYLSYLILVIFPVLALLLSLSLILYFFLSFFVCLFLSWACPCLLPCPFSYSCLCFCSCHGFVGGTNERQNIEVAKDLIRLAG